MPLTPRELKEKIKAQTVLEGFEKRERQERLDKSVQDARPLIGKTFKFRNSYGSHTPEWWLWIEVVGVRQTGYFLEIQTISYQATSSDRLEIIMEWHSHELSEFDGHRGYIPVTKAEFNRGKAEVVARLIGAKS